MFHLYVTRLRWRFPEEETVRWPLAWTFGTYMLPMWHLMCKIEQPLYISTTCPRTRLSCRLPALCGKIIVLFRSSFD